MSALPVLTLTTALTTWRPALLVDLLAFLLLALYLLALRRVTTGAAPWPRSRSVAWVAGVVVLVVSTNSAIAAYGMTLYWMHMIKHLLLIMVVPALLVAGQPLTLLAGTGRRVSGNPVLAQLTRPAVALLLYAAVLVGTHLTSFMSAAMAHPWLHDLEVVLYLGSGYLLFTPLLGDEPVRYRLVYPQRLLVLTVGMMVDTIVGVVLMLTNHDSAEVSGMAPRDWGPPPLTDVHWGGAIMWVIGDGLMLVIALRVMSRWMNDPAKQDSLGSWLDSARRQSLSSFTGTEQDGEVDDDAALAAYNAKLAALAERDRPTRNDQRG
jgi:cytochrome c oxidase assembly factor CtaG